MRITIAVLAVVLAVSAPVLGQAKLTPAATRVVADNNDFALRLYAELAKKDGNLFFSPYSISTALGMTYAGAAGNTAEEMKTTMHFLADPKTLHAGFRDVRTHLLGKSAKRKFELSVANRLFGQKDYGFLPDFLKVGKDFYGAGLQEVDFVGETEKTRQLVSGWVEKETKDRIKELIKKGILNVDTRLVLTNAIYFKAAWSRKFQEKDTTPGEFFVEPGKAVKVPMMRQSWRTNMSDGDGVQVLDMSYEENQLSLYAILPAKDEPLSKLESRFSQENLKKWLSTMGDRIVTVTFPKFKYTSEFALADTLKALGMRDAFNPAAADFSGMTTREKLFISHVIHKAYIDVHEKGTEAAAATAVAVERLSLPPPGTFHANRPFLFVIRDNTSGAILFLGRVADPRG